MGIGWTEIVLVLVIALIALGPAKFPVMARKLGRVYRELRDAVGTVEREVARAAEEPGQETADVPHRPDADDSRQAEGDDDNPSDENGPEHARAR